MASSIEAHDIGAPLPGSSVPAVILAGGRATRMGGGDKTLMTLAGRPVLDHILAGLRPQTEPLALNANGDPARFAAWGLPVLADPWPGQPGPLAGILAAMLWARPFASHVLTWPGDTPHPPRDLTHRLFGAGAGGGVACAGSNGRLHPVVALWPVGLEGDLRRRLESGDGRVLALAQAGGLVVVEWAAQPDPFHNLNTPADLADAEREMGMGAIRA